MKEVRLRFAPSPTGYLHIGGLRTALYNYLFARKMKGKFILRIEDTDRTRFVEGAIENLIKALEWSGIEYDEGVFLEDGKIVQKGDYGPYIQSERTEIYRKYIDTLLEKGIAYHCFCSKERLDDLREGQRIRGEVPKYDGLCRGVSLEEAKERVANGEEYVIRLKLPHNKDIKFHDLVRGNVSINTNDIDDQVLIKSDGFPTYHMAVVIDDHLMGITHIVRGEEWLSSTPKHVYLYEALGWDIPTYVHLPTVLNADRKKLSKREGDVAVEDFKKNGYLPDALINFLLLLGWSPEDNEEIMPLEKMIESFSFERVAKTGGVFDNDKLNWVNAHYIKEKPSSDLLALIEPYLIEAGLADSKFISENKEWMERLIDITKEGTDTLKEFPKKMEFMFRDLEITEEDALEALNSEEFPKIYEALKKELESVGEVTEDFSKSVMKRVGKETGIKGKSLFMPTRAAISFTLHGPDLSSIIYLLGKERLLERLEKAMKSRV